MKEVEIPHFLDGGNAIAGHGPHFVLEVIATFSFVYKGLR